MPLGCNHLKIGKQEVARSGEKFNACNRCENNVTEYNIIMNKIMNIIMNNNE